MITKNSLSVNSVFVVHLLVISLMVIGILPRTVVPFWTIVLVVYVLRASTENSVTFFVRSIPFFIAIPITVGFNGLTTGGFDSLNMWRILSGLIFLKWLAESDFKFIKSPWYFLRGRVKSTMGKVLNRENVSFQIMCLLALAILSIIPAQSNVLAIKRVVYFVNLSLIGIVIYDLVKKNENFSQRLVKNIAIPTIIVALVGMIQLASTYFMDIFRFVDFWGGVVERNMYGNAWADIAIKANTWFAYFGDQLSLRMFSIFPDSHSFPIFLLLGLPAVLAISLTKVVEKSSGGLKMMFKTRVSVSVFFVPIIFLAAILSGTRGIWAAGAATAIWAIFLILRHRKSLDNDLRCRNIFGYISSYLVIFFLLFGPAYYILATDQFRITKGDTTMLGKRVRSLIDISETSNARRIEIWKDSIRSIIKHPLLGVGIGNFPVVVRENLAQAKAGSSAHNLYLHIAAEMGIPALILALWFLWFLLKKIYFNFLQPITSDQSLATIYYGSAIIYLPWVLIYSLTDVAIFDERTFLLFVVTIALTFGSKEMPT